MTLLWEYSVGDEAEQLARVEITWPTPDADPWPLDERNVEVDESDSSHEQIERR